MCGIAGIFNFKSTADGKLVQQMTDALHHRGPDDGGLFVQGAVALGHRRLSILDLSPAGRQPMTIPGTGLWLVYNGEIYNYRDLRAVLETTGVSFSSNTDTEVILRAYQAYGADCLSQFNGMFAFALWDEPRKQLFLARDRFGIKPLYFFRDSKRLIFASEIKPVLLAMGHTPAPNQRLIFDFLTTGTLDHTDDTFFEGIQKLPAAHFAHIDHNGQMAVRRYWDFEVNPDIAPLSDAEIGNRADKFFELLTDSVRLRLVSDVPVGSCLSGGLDSSAIVSVISRMMRQNRASAVGAQQQTFSACYPDSPVDEQPFMDNVIKFTGATANKIFPTAQDFSDSLAALVRHQEEPFGGTSIFAQWEVMRRARERGVTVLLDGQGADEQLLGYRKFYAFYVSELFKRGNLKLALWETMLHFGSWPVLKTLQLRRGLRYIQGRNWGSGTVARLLFQPDFARSFRETSLDLGASGGIAARIKTDMTRFSVPVLLRYEDKNSMAFSREARVPFLDHRLVEFVAAQPLNLKLRNGWTKYLLRRGGKGHVPDKILSRKDKLGFATPEDMWLRQQLAPDMAQAFEKATFLQAFVDVSSLNDQLDAYLAGHRPLLSADFFFRFYILEQWAHTFLE